MLGAERVPQREGRAEGVAVGHMHLIVGPAEPAIGIAPHARREQRVIERGIDAGPHRLGRIDRDRAERRVPRRPRRGADRVEIAGFAGEIGDRARLVHARQRDADFQRLGDFAEIEPCFERATELFGNRIRTTTGSLETLVWHVCLAVYEGVVRDRCREPHREEQFAPRCPAPRLAHPGQRTVRHQPQ
jgi:hypothetical protein